MSTVVALGLLLTVALALALRAREARRHERLARIAHEVRGPLQAALLGLACAQRRPGDPRAAAALLVAVERELARVALALEDLDAERGAVAGAVADAVRTVDLDDLVGAQVRAWGPSAQRRGRPLEFVPGGAPVVEGDPRRIAQATGNLIANAIEHGRGTVRVRVRADGDRVRVEVADDGPGPPATALVPGAGPRDGRGRRGRGLAIAGHAAATLGGRLVCVGPNREDPSVPAVAGRGAVGVELPRSIPGPARPALPA